MCAWCRLLSWRPKGHDRRQEGCEHPPLTLSARFNFLPFADNEAQQGIEIEDKPAPDGTYRMAHLRAVDDGFFRTLGIQMLAGRPLERADMLPGVPPPGSTAPGAVGDSTVAASSRGPVESDPVSVAVVNQTLAERYWPNGDAIGARFRAGGDTLYRVVGIAPVLKWHGFDEEPVARFYIPYTDDPSPRAVSCCTPRATR